MTRIIGAGGSPRVRIEHVAPGVVLLLSRSADGWRPEDCKAQCRAALGCRAPSRHGPRCKMSGRLGSVGRAFDTCAIC
jgi:hypothetical protein